MSSFSTVIILLAITATSLFVVSLINQRQTRARLINQKLQKMKRRVSELEELSAILEPLVDDAQTPQAINEEAVDLIESMLRLAPGNAYYRMSLDTAQQRRADLATPGRKIETFRLMESDASIARSQYALSEAARIVRKRHAAGHLQEAEMENMIKDLSWANFMIKITSNVAQGHKAINRDDVLRAYSYYRKALEVATEGSYNNPKQNQIISEMGEILSGKRRALSTSLMPETMHNPTKDAPTMDKLKPEDRID